MVVAGPATTTVGRMDAAARGLDADETDVKVHFGAIEAHNDAALPAARAPETAGRDAPNVCTPRGPSLRAGGQEPISENLERNVKTNKLAD